MPSIVKELMFKEITEQFEKPYAFISKFEGLTVSDVANLRRSLEKVADRSLVVKKTLAKKLFEQKNYDGADKFLQGPTLVTFGTKEPQAISKALVDYSKENKKVEPQGVIFEDKVYDASFVKRLASMPTRTELLTQTAVRIKSPITGFVMNLSGLLRGFAICVNEIKKQKEAAPAAA